MRAREDGAGVSRTGAMAAAPDLLAPAALAPAAVLRLQRTAGNAVVARMIEAGRASRRSIQRKGRSAPKLQELAVPKVGEGQSIPVQQELVRALESGDCEGKTVRGPEYVVNPPPSVEHDSVIYGRGTPPREFTDDLTTIRGALPEPTEMKSAGTVKPYGYAAFVDEAIHMRRRGSAAVTSPPPSSRRTWSASTSSSST